jgi:hypothetical protein
MQEGSRAQSKGKKKFALLRVENTLKVKERKKKRKKEYGIFPGRALCSSVLCQEG